MATTTTPDSPWPYHFVSVTPEQVQERRDLLTLRGQYAQISALLVFVFASVYSRYADNSNKRKPGQEKSKVKAWLDYPPVAGWGETRRQYLITGMWLMWMVGLSMWKTGDDYLHLTRSLAHTVFANIPFQILLSPKLSTRDPIHRLSGLSQATIVPFHRLFGRLVIFPLVILHGTLYLTYFAQITDPVPLLAKRLEDLDVQLGITASSLVLVLWATSSTWRRLGGLRKKVSRETFYVVHVSLVLVLFTAAYFHVEYARKYVLQALAVYAVDIVAAEVEKARK